MATLGSAAGENLAVELPRRAEVLTQLRRAREFDLLIFGDDLLAVTLAQLAAFNGLKVGLFCEADFGSNCAPFEDLSSPLRSSPPLSFLNFFQRTRAAKELTRIAPQLLGVFSNTFEYSERALLQGCLSWLKLKLASTVGPNGGPVRFERMRTNERPATASKWLVRFTDFRVATRRLLFERLVAARQEGALALNYIACSHCRKTKLGGASVVLTDSLAEGDKLHYEIEARLAIATSMKFAEQVSTESVYELVEPLLAANQAYQILYGMRRQFKLERELTGLGERTLPGGFRFPVQMQRFLARGSELGLNAGLLESALARFGARVNYLLEQSGAFEVLADTILRGEIELARNEELAATPQDLLERRLDLEPQQQERLASKVRQIYDS